MIWLFSFVLLFLSLAGFVPSAHGDEAVSVHWPQFQRIVVLPDTSGSLHAGEYAAVIGSLCRELPDLVIAVGAREVALLPWAGTRDALRSAFRAEVPARPVVPAAAMRLTEGQSVFRRAQEICHEREGDLRKARVEEAERRFRGQVGESLAGLITRLGDTQQGYSRCTDVGASLGRCMRERPGTLCFVVTDGLPECPASSSPIGDLPAGSRVVVVLTPSRGDGIDPSGDTNARARWLREWAPWASVVFSFQASGPVEDWLLPLLDTGSHDAASHDPGAR